MERKFIYEQGQTQQFKMEAGEVCDPESDDVSDHLLRNRVSFTAPGSHRILLYDAGPVPDSERADLAARDLGADPAGEFQYFLRADHAVFVLFAGQSA